MECELNGSMYNFTLYSVCQAILLLALLIYNYQELTVLQQSFLVFFLHLFLLFFWVPFLLLCLPKRC
jgi:hypothetical protein